MAQAPKKKADVHNLEQQRFLHAASVVLARMELASQLGHQYGGSRKLYDALGYDQTPEINYQKLYERYIRQDIAGAVIDRPVDATWRGGFEISEMEQDDETEFEKTWKMLEERLAITSKMRKLDRLSGIGSYGAMLLGFDDVQDNAEFKNEAKPKNLLYLRPLGQLNAQIKKWERDPNNERYGQPLTYSVRITEPGYTGAYTQGDSGYTGGYQELEVHHSRIIHVAKNTLESDIEGRSEMLNVYNRLMDLDKLVGGSAEMYWRGARPGYQGKVDENYQLTDEDRTALKDQIQEFEHNLRRLFVNRGVNLEALKQEVADPTGHVTVQLQMISAAKNIPIRILTGSERGELASTEDRNTWFDFITGRREEFADQVIVRPFVDRLIVFGILPKPIKGYSVEWDDLYAASDDEKANVGKTRAEALKAYAESMASEIVPEDSFLELFLGLSTEEIERIVVQRAQAIMDEGNEDLEGEEQDT